MTIRQRRGIPPRSVNRVSQTTAMTPRRSMFRRIAFLMVSGLLAGLFLLMGLKGWNSTADAAADREVENLLARLGDPGIESRWGAAQSLARFRSRAVPRLLDELPSEDHARQTAVLWALAAIGHEARAAVPAVIEILEREPDSAAAVETLRKTGAGREAVPVLVNVLRGGHFLALGAARDALRDIGRPAVLALVDVLREGDHLASPVAAEILAEIGSPTEAALGELLALVHNEDDAPVSLYAAGVIARVSGDADATGKSMDVLLRCLRRRERIGEVPIGWVAAEELGKIGRGAAEPLLGQLSVSDPEVRGMAARGLGEIKDRTALVTPALADALQDQDPRVRAVAAASLWNLAPPEPLRSRVLQELVASSAVEESPVDAFVLMALHQAGQEATDALVEGLRHPQPRVRRISATMLRRHLEASRRDSSIEGGSTAKVLQALQALLESPSAGVRAHAALQLGLLAERGFLRPGCVTTLTDLLRDPEPRVRCSVAAALTRFGPAARDAVEELFDALVSPQENLRHAAARAIGAIGRERATSAERLVELLARARPEVRPAVLEALHSLGPAAHQVVPRISSLLGDPDIAVRREAAKALAAMGHGCLEATRALEKALRQEDPWVRLFAASGLAHSSPHLGERRAALRTLIGALRGDDTRLVGQAALALADLKENARPALPEIRRAMRRIEEMGTPDPTAAWSLASAEVLIRSALDREDR